MVRDEYFTEVMVKISRTGETMIRISCNAESQVWSLDCYYTRSTHNTSLDTDLRLTDIWSLIRTQIWIKHRYIDRCIQDICGYRYLSKVDRDRGRDLYIYMYIYVERERERKKEIEKYMKDR